MKEYLVMDAPEPRTAGIVGEIGWTLLAVLLAALLTGAFFYDRSGARLLAGEATHLMQAESLVHDFDSTYTCADFDRFLLRLHGDPTDLALVSISPERITFDRPFPYALWLAPFLVLWPANGFAVANVVLLALVCLLAARTLQAQGGLGPWAPLVVAVAVFGSVLFAHVFLATGDLFRFALTLAGFCALVRGSALLAGALLAVPVATYPPYGVLLLAAFFVLPPEERGAARGRLAAGALATLGLIFAVRWLAVGGLPFSGSRFRFTAATGFPLVDFPAAEWPQAVARLGALEESAAPSFAWGVDLWLWNLIYLLAGQTIGLLPYFAPLVLLFLAGGSSRRRALILAAVAWTAAMVVLRPFDLAGGGVLANRLFLPVYGALFLVAATRSGGDPGWRRPLLVLAVTLALAAPFLGKLWREPWAYPIDEGRGPRHPTELARWFLPFEASQRELVREPDRSGEELEVVALTDATWGESRQERWVHAGPGPAELLIASPSPIATLRLEIEGGAAGGLAVRGGRLGERLPAEAGAAAFRIVPRGLRRHPTWWSSRRAWLYRLSLDLPTADSDQVFRLAPAVGEPTQEK